MSSWTTADIAILEKSIAQGALRVKYADKEVEYRSLADMLRLLDVMRKDLGVTSKNSGRKFANFSKGIE
jgi:hypothetical protein